MSVRVRLAGAAASAHALLGELGAGRVTSRPGRAPRAERGHASIARTDGLLAVAWAPHPVGVDVERVRPLPDLRRLVQDHLGDDDARRVRSARDPTAAFYEVWTGLEAVLKAEGRGIVDGLDPAPEVRARWHVTTLAVGPLHRGALAVPAA